MFVGGFLKGQVEVFEDFFFCLDGVPILYTLPSAQNRFYY